MQGPPAFYARAPQLKVFRALPLEPRRAQNSMSCLSSTKRSREAIPVGGECRMQRCRSCAVHASHCVECKGGGGGGKCIVLTSTVYVMGHPGPSHLLTMTPSTLLATE